MTNFKDTIKTFYNFKKATKVYEVMFFDKYKYVYSENAINTLYIEINKNLKEILFRQNKQYKKYSLFSFASSNSSQFYFQFVIFI